MATHITVIGKANTISAQLAAIQRLVLVPNGKQINPEKGE